MPVVLVEAIKGTQRGARRFGFWCLGERLRGLAG